MVSFILNVMQSVMTDAYKGKEKNATELESFKKLEMQFHCCGPSVELKKIWVAAGACKNETSDWEFEVCFYVEDFCFFFIQVQTRIVNVRDVIDLTGNDLPFLRRELHLLNCKRTIISLVLTHFRELL